MKKFTLFAFWAMFAMSFLAYSANAADPTMDELLKEIKALKARVEELENKAQTVNDRQDNTIDNKVGKVKARKKKEPIFAEKFMPGEFKIGANMTTVLQGSPDSKLLGGDKRGKLGGSYQANVTLVNQFSGVNGLALANLRVDDGNGIESDMTLYSNVDNNAWPFQEFTLSEIFYEQHLLDDKIIMNFGKLDPTVFFDQNLYQDSDTTQFLSRIFNNSPVIEFPANSGGIRAAYFPYKWLELDYLVMAGNRDMKDMEANIFQIGEVTLSPKIGDRPGNYRFAVWQNTNDHTKWKNTSQKKEETYGFSISCDQEVTDAVGVFGKFGWQNPKAYNPDRNVNVKDTAMLGTTPEINNYSLEYMWSTGFQVKGALWRREHDLFGVAIGQVIPSNDMEEALENSGANSRKALPEGHAEVYYNFYANQYLAISPGVQFIWNPYGADNGGDDLISVYTVRTHVDF